LLLLLLLHLRSIVSEERLLTEESMRSHQRGGRATRKQLQKGKTVACRPPVDHRA
jgi:hypothetical protein